VVVVVIMATVVVVMLHGIMVAVVMVLLVVVVVVVMTIMTRREERGMRWHRHQRYHISLILFINSVTTVLLRLLLSNTITITLPHHNRYSPTPQPLISNTIGVCCACGESGGV
jgi:hypothetical protein